MLDKFTFGKTPAAIYLADRLNTLNDPKYSRKISSHIHTIQSLIAELIEAHESGSVSINLLNFTSRSLRAQIKVIAQNLYNDPPHTGSGGHPVPDVLAINLMTNVMMGDLKSIDRRAAGVTLYKKSQEAIIRHLEKTGVTPTAAPKKLTIADIKETTTADTLIERSRRKLKRLGLPNTLYDKE
jgi:hypothetical protein